MDTTIAIPWYKSSIVVGIGVSLVCKALVLSGLTGDIAGEQQQQLANILATLLGGMGDLFALYKRTQQTHAPVLALTASSAARKVEAAVPAPVIDTWVEPVAPAAVAFPLAAQADALDEEVPSWMR